MNLIIQEVDIPAKERSDCRLELRTLYQQLFMNKTRITTLAVCAVMGFSARAQNLLLNGSFESPSIPANTIQSATPTSWTWSGTSGVVHNDNSGDPSVWPLPQDGQQYVDIGNESIYALSQAFTITNQEVYVLHWNDSAGHSGGLTTSPYSVAVLTGALETFTSTNLDAYHATFGAWVARTIQLTLSPGTYTLRFRAEGVFNGLGSLIDNVSLDRLPAGLLLINGSFEIPGHGDLFSPGAFHIDQPQGSAFLVGWTSWFWRLPTGSDYLTGWTIGGGGVDYFGKDGNASSGRYYLDLVKDAGAGGSISQQVSGLEVGTNYYVFFDVNQGVLGAGTTITVRAGQVSAAILNTAPAVWQTHSLRFVATNSSTTVSFAAPPSGALDLGVYIDNIQISTLSNSPIRLVPQTFQGIKVEGILEQTYRIEYAETLPAANWSLSTRVVLTNSPTWVYDELRIGPSQRFYRSVQE